MRSGRTRTALAIGISVAAVAVMVAALWPRGEVARTDAERAEHIAARLRCPFCNGESIGDATSQVARDLEEVIREQVAAGMTDDEIFDYFAQRYGESLLLDPPLLGWGWALWALPLGGLVVGVAVVARRRRRSSDPVGPLPKERIEDRLEAIARDHTDIGEQVAGGELDPELGRALTAVLDDEEAGLMAALEGLEEETEPSGAQEPPPRRWSRRALAGTAAVLVGAAAVTATLIVTGEEEGGRGIVDAPPVDLGSVSIERLEEVVAANPDVVGMRLALAQLLMEQGEVLRAAQHFNEVLQREDNPEAMAWLGYIAFLAGQYETAEGFLTDALSIVPDYPQAQWWLAIVRMDGRGDPEGAIEPLEALLASEGVPPEIRLEAEAMLGEARAAAP